MTATHETLEAYESRGLVRRSRHPSLPLTVWCATGDGPWDEVTSTARGLVLHDDGTLVGRGFPKFHEHDDPSVSMPPRTEPFVAVDMVDGVGIYATLFEGSLLVWADDTFVGPSVDVATELMTGWKPREGTTAVFEGVFKFARRIVDYGPFEGLVLLGEVEHSTEIDWTSPQVVSDETGWWGEVAVERSIPVHTLMKLVSDPENGEGWEGFVLVYPRVGGPALRVSARFARYRAARAA